LRRHPKLLPTFAAPSILAMIRSRASIVDRMIEEEAHRVRKLGGLLTYWTFGGGFDARWYRLRPTLEQVITTHCEVEEPDVMDFKNHALADSTFSNAWQRIQRIPVREERWTVQDGSSKHILVVLEGVAARLGIDIAKRILTRIRRDAPNARVVLDLPGILQSTQNPGGAPIGARTRWASPAATSAASLTGIELERIGWRIEEDVWLAARPELRAPSGMAMCSGMEALRVIRLSAKED
jgi:O-methyltransferase involved in polyketide biosynthesis